MAIRVMCDANEPGAVLDEHWTKEVRAYRPEAEPIYMKEYAKGAVVSLREANYHDDSDFYATYWDGEKFSEVCYASTRGWTYPNGAAVDASPEIMEKWEAHLAALREAAKKAAEEREKLIPRVGKHCVILPNKGKAKEAVGEEGVIFWCVEEKSRYGTWSRGWRVGVRTNKGRYFLSAEKVRML